MLYKGFEVTPLGNAKITPRRDELHIETIGKSGLDGILINTEGHESVTVHYDRFETLIKNKGTLTETFSVKNDEGVVLTYREAIKMYDPNSDTVKFGFNNSLLPEQFYLVGWLDGKEVFRFEEKRDDWQPPPSEEIIGKVWKAIKYVGNVIKDAWNSLNTSTNCYVKPEVKYEDGKVKVGVTAGCTIDPEPFDIEVNGKIFTINNMGIEWTENWVGYAHSDIWRIASMKVTGSNLDHFTIKSITK